MTAPTVDNSVSFDRLVEAANRSVVALRQLNAFNEHVAQLTSRCDFDLDPTPYDDVVSRGVELLDERVGREFWLERVNLETLDVASAFECVACQVTGLHFTESLDVLGAPRYNTGQRHTWVEDRGFAAGFATWSYRQLTATWAQRIMSLRVETATRKSAEVAK